jgi:hypothetical protein
LKLLIPIIAILFSSFVKTSDPSTEKVCGTWKGYFGTESEINSLTIKINPQNKAEIFCNFNEACLKTSGTYKLIGDSAIVISCILIEKKGSEIILYGNLNRTTSFIDGQWDGDGSDGGCFYLQKQFSQPNL